MAAIRLGGDSGAGAGRRDRVRGAANTRVAMGLAAFAALFSLFPLLTGSYTPVGLGITAALIAECFLLYRRFHTSK